MTDEKIIDGIKSVFVEYLEIETDLEPSTHLTRDLQLDSLQGLTLVVELENHFQIAFNEGDENGVETISDLIELVRKTQKAQGVEEDD